MTLDDTTAIPATAGAAEAMQAAARFANTLSAIFEVVDLGAAASSGAAPKALLEGFCPAGGGADLVLPDGPVSSWQPGDEITLTLTNCQGSPLSPGSLSGNVVLQLETININVTQVLMDVAASIALTGDATATGDFKAFAAVGLSGTVLRIGKQLDDDRLVLSDETISLELGCFDIDVSFRPEANAISPLAVAKLSGQVYTINDYAQEPPPVFFDGDGIPNDGQLAIYSGDNSAASPDRSGPCYADVAPGDGSTITAAFSEGGCVEITGSANLSTSWEKLRAGDLSPGGGPGCGGDVLCEAVEGAVELIDTELRDSDWEITFVSQTEGGTIEQEAAQQASGGVDDGSFRQMTHVINQTTNCPDETCSLVVYHQSSLTYDPSQQGAIAFIDYSEAQRVIEAAFEGAAVGWAFYAEQDGSPYLAFGEETAFSNTAWRTNSACGLTPESFSSEGLDFSSNGGPITFGFTRSNTNTSTVNVQRNVHGVDDFKVVIVKQ
jgi:hypothetical protein